MESLRNSFFTPSFRGRTNWMDLRIESRNVSRRWSDDCLVMQPRRPIFCMPSANLSVVSVVGAICAESINGGVGLVTVLGCDYEGGGGSLHLLWRRRVFAEFWRFGECVGEGCWFCAQECRGRGINSARKLSGDRGKAEIMRHHVAETFPNYRGTKIA